MTPGSRFSLPPATGSLQAQILLNVGAATLLMLGLASAFNVWLTLGLAERSRQAHVATTIHSLRHVWLAIRDRPVDQRLQLLQQQIDAISNGTDLYVVHPRPGSVLLPPNWAQLPGPMLTAMRSDHHRRGVPTPIPSPLRNATGESFEIRTYPFAGGPSHVHVAHNLSSDGAYLRQQLLLLLLLFPVGALLSLGLGALLSRRIVEPIVALDRQLQDLSPDHLQEVLQEIRTAPRELRHHTVILQQLLARLAEARDSQGAFVSYVNHELRNSLMIMQGNLRWLQRSSNRFDDRQKRAFAAALDENRRLSTMVTDLLDLSKADAHRLAIPLRPVEVPEILEQCAELTSRAYQRPVEIRIIPPPETAALPPALANPDRLSQVLMNLLENAVKFSEPSTAIRLQLARTDPATLSVEVIDQGPGIPEADQPHIFDRFYRAPATATRTPGSGLGLTLARLLSEAMGGRLELRSSGAQGTVFRLSLPCAVPAA
ncbi:MAG: sensor histidine kinase [Cyanobium sp.]